MQQPSVPHGETQETWSLASKAEKQTIQVTVISLLPIVPFDCLDGISAYLCDEEAIRVEWENQCRRQSDGWMRTNMVCPKCKHQGMYWTGNYSLSASADVENTTFCPNPKCRHTYIEYS
eukprot:PhF_6_TR14830/c0_g1_i1/m.23171